MKPERVISEDYKRRITPFFEDFNKTLDELENKMEEDLIELLSKLQIRASKKQDKYSLPYTNEILKTLILESYVQGFLEYERIFPEIVKELLNKNVNKIRFYIHIEPYDIKNNFFGKGLKYNFRYYIHK